MVERILLDFDLLINLQNAEYYFVQRPTHNFVFYFIHFWSVTLVNTIKTTSFTPPSVTKLYLYVCIHLYMFRFLANHLQKAHQHCKGNYHYMMYLCIV
jgi:hypothetical protein